MAAFLFILNKDLECPEKWSQQEIIDKFIEKHGYRYNYGLVVYKGYNTKVCIICYIHGEFDQTPHAHIAGQGCKNCGHERGSAKQKSNKQEFLQKIYKIYGDEFDYSLYVYINAITKGIIICKKHGQFKQSPNAHLSKHGCDECGGTRKFTLNEFIEKANKKHNNRYDYSNFILINCHIKGFITCFIHGDFKQTPSEHLGGAGCWSCGGSKKLTTDEFLIKAKKVHGDKYDYTLTVYGKNTSDKVIIICKKHGLFPQTPDCHLQGGGCSLCKNKNEGIVWQFLTDNNIDFMYQYNVKLPINKRQSKIDFYIISLNLFIEYNGDQHYEPVTFGGSNLELAKKAFKKRQIRDHQLRDYCKTNNINLLEIDGRTFKGKKLEKYLYTYFFNILSMINLYS